MKRLFQKLSAILTFVLALIVAFAFVGCAGADKDYAGSPSAPDSGSSDGSGDHYFEYPDLGGADSSGGSGSSGGLEADGGLGGAAGETSPGGSTP